MRPVAPNRIAIEKRVAAAEQAVVDRFFNRLFTAFNGHPNQICDAIIADINKWLAADHGPSPGGNLMDGLNCIIEITKKHSPAIAAKLPEGK